MPDLLQSLMEQDFGFLQIIAEFWDVEAPKADTPPERAALVRRMLEPDTFRKTVEVLPESAAQVLADLQQNEGRIPWSIFTRKYGEVREFGPGRRDREQPYLQPVSVAEMLWYRAFIARAFMRKSGLLQEYAFIPSDIEDLLPPPVKVSASTASIPVSIHSQEYVPVNNGDGILEHCCTLLAALRSGGKVNLSVHLPVTDEHKEFLADLIHAAGMVDVNGVLAQEEIKEHLESSRSEAWQGLFRYWSSSSIFNDLTAVSELIVEKSDGFSPCDARKSLLGLLVGQAVGKWIYVGDFVQHVKQANPEFMRPDGNFDTWLIRSADTGNYLTGFEHWETVEGAYIRHMICGPLHWMGLVELGYPSHARIAAGFRITNAGYGLLLGSSPPDRAEEKKILFKPGAQINCPVLLPRWARYLLARMSEWIELNNDGYLYQFTPQSLAEARKQTLRVSHLIVLLRKFGSIPPSPSFVRSLQRWEDHGSEVSLESIHVLRVTSPEILQEILKSRAARFLAESLGPTTVVIKPGVTGKLSHLLVDLGYLGEIKSGL
jgi:hypothetical protein